MELTLREAPPLALYVHFPWCVRKCPYCDFNSWTMGEDAPLDRYVAALLRDLDNEAARAGTRELISIFLGGGTPSVFSPAHIAAILAGVSGRFSLAADVEVTMEANPGTVECGDLAGYRAAGVNRLSVGAQSFSAAALAALGRIHGVDDVRRTVGDARDAGFDNINIDIMYGLPGQDIAAAMEDIEQTASLAPEHLSWYQLTLEPNTVFHARPPRDLPDADALFEIQERGAQRLEELGYAQYEVSAWARHGRQCRHNLNYWSYGDYLAVGAGAHGKLSDAAGISRSVRPVHPRQYMETVEAGTVPGSSEPVGPAERLFEYILNVSRLTADFGEPQFTARTALPGPMLRERLERPLARGLVEPSGADCWRLTELGRRFLNDFQADFLPG